MPEIPDHVPDELARAYGAYARRAVRHGRSLRWRAARAARALRIHISDPRAWLRALSYMATCALLIAAFSAVIVITIRRPIQTFAVLLPLLGMISLAIAARLWRRDPDHAPASLKQPIGH
ncbi:MAG: hypothetical protein ABR552_08985 [Actinomycetota bacterium]